MLSRDLTCACIRRKILRMSSILQTMEKIAALGIQKAASPFLHPEVHKAMVDTHNGLLQGEANKMLRDGILVGTGAGAGAGSILAGIGKKLGKNITKTKFGLLAGTGALLGGTGFGLLSNQAAKRFDKFKLPTEEQ